MAVSNYERVGKGLEFVKQGLTPFVTREMEASYGSNWKTEAQRTLQRETSWQGRNGDVLIDVQALFILMWMHWNDVFKKTLGHAERSIVSELRDVRNKWAHQQSFSTDDAYRALDSMERLLTAVAADEARELANMKQELLRIRFAEQARREKRRASVAPTEGRPAPGLKPWREIMTPHPDVASGRYQQAEFAADLYQVYQGKGAPEYRDPREFFHRTFLTDGLRHLLKNALYRLNGDGGDPAIELQTNFGGGKTHSMLALYHMVGGTPAGELAGIDEVLQEVGTDWLPRANRAVLVGTALSPGDTVQKPDGTVVRTLWGEMAWQLGGAEGYQIVASADEQGVSPGSGSLRELFTEFGPCLILIDEWVRYVGQTYQKTDLPGGSFDANITFAQALTEAARQAADTLVVASIPASDIEMGGEGGKEALARLKNTFSRMESAWRPASTEEGFEIVRRRLFQPIADPHKFAERDAVISAFSQLYRDQPHEFPEDCREGEYRRRMEAAYPIHPELFDRLFGEWSSLDKFQRTRGVLRLMASVIYSLWERNDSSLLILPANIPMDAPDVQFELTRYLEDPWTPVIEKDVDGPNSLPLNLERENPNLARYSASRRVARTIYMGSAPNEHANNPGIDERYVKLGCVQPGESVATFGDALRRLTDQATHLYVDGKRYWYSTQPSVTRLAQDRAVQQDGEDVWEELRKRLRTERARGEFVAVHVAPESSDDVPDDMTARLVVLDPKYTHASKTPDSPAFTEAQSILQHRGNSPRIYRNMLVFLAADRARLADLEQAVRQYLAWKSIVDEKEQLNLNSSQSNQAKTKQSQAEEAVKTRIGETYTWLLVPGQPDPQGDVEWEEIRLQGQDPLAERASKKLIREESLITHYSAARLRIDLDRHLWKDRNHLGLKQLWDYFATYLYLPRLRDQNVLINAISDGINQITWDDNFAYAEKFSEADSRYLNLQTGSNFSGRIMIDSEAVLVKPEIAVKQMKEDEDRRADSRSEQEPTRRDGWNGDSEHPISTEGDEPITTAEQKKVRRFFGTVQLDALRIGRDVGKIAEEVVQHLVADHAQVEVTLEIKADFPEEASDHVVRTVTENSRVLKFTHYGFEEE